jgi:hypothetical protein
MNGSKTVRISKSQMKMMLITSFVIKGIVHFEFISQGQTVNRAYYVEILVRLHEAARRKRPELHAFLTSAVDGGEWSGPRSGRFTPGVSARGTRRRGDWVGLRAGLDAVAKRKKSYHCTCLELNPGRPARS